MKKLLLSATLAASVTGAAHAQFGYTFTAQTGQAYTPLTTGATNLTATTRWDDQVFSAPIPFTFQLDRRALTSLRITDDGGLVFLGRASANADTATGFSPMDANLHDRGTAASPKSPIRYAVSGTSPSRIFKLEFFNAGFVDDAANADSVNFQVWLYEGSNAVELRYGTSRLTPGNLVTYFPAANGNQFAGMFKNVDYNNGTFGKLYYLRGVSTLPTLDSMTLPGFPTTGIATYPASGTVYRFTPTTGGGSTGVAEAFAAARAMKIYPTVATSTVTVEWAGEDSETYQILSATGALVSVGRLQRGVQQIDVNWLPAGTYNIRVAAGGHVFVKR